MSARIVSGDEIARPTKDQSMRTEQEMRRRHAKNRGKSKSPPRPKTKAPPTPRPEFNAVRQTSLSDSIVQKMFRFAKVADDPDLQFAYEGLLAGPMSQLSACNLIALQFIEKEVYRAIKRGAHGDDFQVGLLTETFKPTPASELMVPMKQLRSSPRNFSKAGVSSISWFGFVDVPDLSDSSGWALQPQMRALLFGQHAQQSVARARMSSLGSARAAGANIEWIDVESKKAVRNAVKQVFYFPLVGSQESRDAAAAEGLDGAWMKASRVGPRSVVHLAVLSLLPLNRAVMSQHAGRGIIEPALRAVLEQQRQDFRGVEPAIHRDGIAQFWAKEFRRLGFDGISVPVVQIR